MTTYDPRILIRAFDTLQEEFKRFNQVSSETLKQAESTQRFAQERVNQARRSSAIVTNQAKSDLEDVVQVDQEVYNLLSNSSAAIEIAHQTLEVADEARQQAEATLVTWQNELNAALEWQARAEARLEIAKAEYERAERNLESALQRLESAEASLRRCRNDPERKSCNSEEQAYRYAQEAVTEARQELRAAEQELRAAEADLARAKARVHCCRQAVGYATDAVQHANLAKEQANQALNEAERSLESLESASRATTKASTNATEEYTLAEQATDQVRQAEELVIQAQLKIQIARTKGDSAYDLAIRGNQELRYRQDQLIRFNQTENSISQPSSRENSFADSLQYLDEYNHLERKDGYKSVMIKAKNIEGEEIGYIIAGVADDNRVKIKDTGVSDSLQKKGVGSNLLASLESKFPSGTELYFQENQSPEFWQKKGFQSRTKQDGSTEFFKII